MKWQLKDALDNLDENDLYSIQTDLSKGGAYLKKLVNDRIRDIEKSKKSICVTCGNDLQLHPKSYTLVFGPDDFRKKASFCEIDCLEYFLSNLKSIQRGEKHQLQTSD